jgi:diguanylate cyclase (GGDEF)-like protein
VIDERSGFLSRLPATAVALIGVLGILAVGVIDDVSGVEVRVVPLYYVPLSLVAWELGRRPVVAAAALCAICWTAANYLAGQTFSSTGVWVFNVMMQGLSFAAVGLLIAALRGALVHERALSRTDTLTSLLNARTFYEEAARVLALSRRKRHPVSLAYVDLDNFKSVNDTLGHRAGDEILRAVGAIILGCTRKSDVAARLGGDEFVLLMPETGPDQARLACDRLRTLVAERFSGDANPVTASVGGVAFLTVPDRVDDMVHAADGRMYAAKAAGRNRVDVEVVAPVSAGAAP